jgi:hypothetical protein
MMAIGRRMIRFTQKNFVLVVINAIGQLTINLVSHNGSVLNSLSIFLVKEYQKDASSVK